MNRSDPFGLMRALRVAKLRERERVEAIAEHRGRLKELAELRTLAGLMSENGRTFDDFGEALRDRERVMLRETHVLTKKQSGRSRDDRRTVPILE